MSEIPGQSGHALPDLQPPVCAIRRLRGRFEIGCQACQLLQQQLGLLQVERIKSFGEPAVDRRKKITGFAVPVLCTASDAAYCSGVTAGCSNDCP